MAKTNARAVDHRTDTDARVAGGFGSFAARQDAEARLRRAVLANLLWEDVAYQDGRTVASEICELVPQVEPETVAQIAVVARTEQRLRHVPLLLARECARRPSHRHVVADLLPRIIRRPDELTEFVALYWHEGRQPLANGVKQGLARAFERFNAYQLAKYNGGKREIKLRDVMFLVHPKPTSGEQAATFKALAENALETPDTWEVALSTGADKRETWERLICEGKLGALAFLRNLRNMEEVGVSRDTIRMGFRDLRTDWLLPLNFFAAAQAAPRWLPEIEEAMFRSLSEAPKLAGDTILVVDVSGSMGARISSRSVFNRLDAAAAMAVLAREMCEHVSVWATAGSDHTRTHRTEMLAPYRGFALAREIVQAAHRLGGGGIFTRQCLEHIEASGEPAGDRTIVLSDSQDCDWPGSGLARPFSPRNYIVDVSAHTRGIGYDGVWTAEVAGWSEHFLEYIRALETTDEALAANLQTV